MTNKENIRPRKKDKPRKSNAVSQMDVRSKQLAMIAVRKWRSFVKKRINERAIQTKAIKALKEYAKYEKLKWARKVRAKFHQEYYNCRHHFAMWRVAATVKKQNKHNYEMADKRSFRFIKYEYKRRLEFNRLIGLFELSKQQKILIKWKEFYCDTLIDKKHAPAVNDFLMRKSVKMSYLNWSKSFKEIQMNVMKAELMAQRNVASAFFNKLKMKYVQILKIKKLELMAIKFQRRKWILRVKQIAMKCLFWKPRAEHSIFYFERRKQREYFHKIKARKFNEKIKKGMREINSKRDKGLFLNEQRNFQMMATIFHKWILESILVNSEAKSFIAVRKRDLKALQFYEFNLKKNFLLLWRFTKQIVVNQNELFSLLKLRCDRKFLKVAFAGLQLLAKREQSKKSFLNKGYFKIKSLYFNFWKDSTKFKQHYDILQMMSLDFDMARVIHAAFTKWKHSTGEIYKIRVQQVASNIINEWHSIVVKKKKLKEKQENLILNKSKRNKFFFFQFWRDKIANLASFKLQLEKAEERNKRNIKVKSLNVWRNKLKIIEGNKVKSDGAFDRNRKIFMFKVWLLKFRLFECFKKDEMFSLKVYNLNCLAKTFVNWRSELFSIQNLYQESFEQFKLNKLINFLKQWRIHLKRRGDLDFANNFYNRKIKSKIFKNSFNLFLKINSLNKRLIKFEMKKDLLQIKFKDWRFKVHEKNKLKRKYLIADNFYFNLLQKRSLIGLYSYSQYKIDKKPYKLKFQKLQSDIIFFRSINKKRRVFVSWLQLKEKKRIERIPPPKIKIRSPSIQRTLIDANHIQSCLRELEQEKLAHLANVEDYEKTRSLFCKSKDKKIQKRLIELENLIKDYQATERARAAKHRILTQRAEALKITIKSL
ncbi:hypothetical protein ROZALSC1DRAFT_29676 [Rozella allomycis CSF55]|uniref:Sfi1 spindle body domain-containing protein n=1 Tax=Rozella allomycis (strain CSF55) TaxID=988480 RepID=A0A075AN08_ROZAC|nr:hypothetical protein O9G_001032 [Rozella allomycis CSF55]RKP18654.1 hypothetical protein ROZALSC1DRAFT_29676 [Rozella allomycis CSF55]|eukprot:EPZ31121.1 hypothetical protein O9G_001032 [Rozella allomycis CSF55]